MSDNTFWMQSVHRKLLQATFIPFIHSLIHNIALYVPGLTNKNTFLTKLGFIHQINYYLSTRVIKSLDSKQAHTTQSLLTLKRMNRMPTTAKQIK